MTISEVMICSRAAGRAGRPDVKNYRQNIDDGRRRQGNKRQGNDMKNYWQNDDGVAGESAGLPGWLVIRRAGQCRPQTSPDRLAAPCRLWMGKLTPRNNENYETSPKRKMPKPFKSSLFVVLTVSSPGKTNPNFAGFPGPANSSLGKKPRCHFKSRHCPLLGSALVSILERGSATRSRIARWNHWIIS
jgi:hypothetical protein